MFYTVRQVAEKLDMSEHTIRYYTDMKLFPCERDSGNRRIFDDAAINWLIGIRNLRACGMSIDSIKEYCDLCRQGDGSIPQRQEIIEEQKRLAKLRLEEAERVYAYMEKKALHYQEILEKRVPDNTNPDTWEKEPHSATA